MALLNLESKNRRFTDKLITTSLIHDSAEYSHSKHASCSVHVPGYLSDTWIISGVINDYRSPSYGKMPRYKSINNFTRLFSDYDYDYRLEGVRSGYVLVQAILDRGTGTG